MASATTQVVERIFGDAREYHTAALAFTERRYPVAAEAPFVYRVATPWLASVINPALKRVTPPEFDALVDYATGLDDVLPFYVINIGATLVCALLLLRYFRYFLANAWLRLLLLAMWLMQWHTPARWVFFNPINVEPLFLLAVVASLLVMEQWRGQPWHAAAILAPLLFAGTLTREAMVLMAVVFVAASRSAASALPLLASLAGLALTRVIGSPSHPYDPTLEPIKMIATKAPDSWALAWFFTFGPGAVAVVAAHARGSWALLRERPDLLVWVAGCGVLAYVGGSDTERILGWAAPVIYVLIGRALEAHWPVLRRHPLALAALATVQLCSARVFWPVPVGYDDPQPLPAGFSVDTLREVADRFFVMHHNYANLWSYFGSRSLHRVNLALDVVFAVAVIAWLRRRRAAA